LAWAEVLALLLLLLRAGFVGLVQAERAQHGRADGCPQRAAPREPRSERLGEPIELFCVHVNWLLSRRRWRDFRLLDHPSERTKSA